MEAHSFTNSTMIDSAQYDPGKQSLTVIFRKSPRPYLSSIPVPQSAYDGLVAAPSAGRYYRDEIAGKYGMVKA